MDFKEVTNPSLEVFEKPVIDRSIVEYEYAEYEQLQGVINKKEGDKYTIETKDADQFLLPHKALLHFRGKIQNYNDPSSLADYTAGDKLTLVNNAWAQFTSLQYQINNQIIEDIVLYLPEASTILNTVMFSDDYSRSTATNQFWFKDTGVGAAVSDEFESAASVLDTTTYANATKIKGTDPPDTFTFELLRKAFSKNNERVSNYNQGFKSRMLLTDNGKMVSVFLPLAQVLGSHRDIDTVYRGVKHTYILTRASPSNYIHAASGVTNSDKAQFMIEDISIWMPQVKPSLAELSRLDGLMAAGVEKPLYFEQVNIYRKTFDGATIAGTWDVATNSSMALPNHIFMCFQATTQENSFEQNNMIFQHAKLTQARCWINSVQYPKREFTCDFTDKNDDYSRLYMAFQSAVGKYSDTDSGSQISIADFKNLYPIIHFDTSKRDDLVNIHEAKIKLEWRLASRFQYPSGTNANYNVYCLVLSDRFLTLQGIGGKMTVIV